jgi:hypothetical protein
LTTAAGWANVCECCMIVLQPRDGDTSAGLLFAIGEWVELDHFLVPRFAIFDFRF